MAKKKAARKSVTQKTAGRKPVVRKSGAKKSGAKKSAVSKRTVKKPAARRAAVAKRARTVRREPAEPNPLSIPVKGAERREVGGVRFEVGRAGAARVKRVVYPAGFRWSVDMKPLVGTAWCMHAHVGFLVQGQIHIEYADGCVVEHKAPQILSIEPGHDGWVVGRKPAVLIEFDFEGETIRRLGMPAAHRHQ